MNKKKILLIQPTPYDQHGNLVKKSKLYFVGLALPLQDFHADHMESAVLIKSFFYSCYLPPIHFFKY